MDEEDWRALLWIGGACALAASAVWQTWVGNREEAFLIVLVACVGALAVSWAMWRKARRA